MEITQLHSIKWSDENKKGVLISANIVEPNNVKTNNVTISTPYDDSSILWGYLQTIPFEQIQEPDPIPPEVFSEPILEQRLLLLRQSDWTQLADVPLSAEKKAEWNTYRQALRDITLQEGYPQNVVWPTEPV